MSIASKNEKDNQRNTILHMTKGAQSSVQQLSDQFTGTQHFESETSLKGFFHETRDYSVPRQNFRVNELKRIDRNLPTLRPPKNDKSHSIVSHHLPSKLSVQQIQDLMKPAKETSALVEKRIGGGQGVPSQTSQDFNRYF